MTICLKFQLANTSAGSLGIVHLSYDFSYQFSRPSFMSE